MHSEIILHHASQSGELDSFFRDICIGFEKPKKTIPSKYMYDAEGSKLFSTWTQTPQYYVWRCQNELITLNAEKILEIFGKQHFNLVDLGAGDATKTMVLIEAAIRQGYDFEYIPLDISYDSNKALSENLKKKFPTLNTTLLTSKFKDGVKWVCENKRGRNVFLFMGATIGNIEQIQTLKDIIKYYGETLKTGDLFIAGFDKFKDPFVIQQAYTNEQRPLEPIALNFIKRINRQLNGNLDPQNFFQHSYYDPLERRIKTGLISKKDQTFTINGKDFFMEEAETLNFFNSKKWKIKEGVELFEEFNFKKVGIFEDSKGYFAQIYFEKI